MRSETGDHAVIAGFFLCSLNTLLILNTHLPFQCFCGALLL
jgi:hypothetical protein